MCCAALHTPYGYGYSQAAAEAYNNAVGNATDSWNQASQAATDAWNQAIDSAVQTYNGTMASLQSQANQAHEAYEDALVPFPVRGFRAKQGKMAV